MFGKGGMVNISAVQTKILTDWYQGKLNYIFEWFCYLSIFVFIFDIFLFFLINYSFITINECFINFYV